MQRTLQQTIFNEMKLCLFILFMINIWLRYFFGDLFVYIFDRFFK